MNRTRMLLCLPALLAVALTVSPVRADPELPKNDAQEILKQLKEMQNQLKEMKEMQNQLKEMQGDYARLRGDFNRMQQDNESRQQSSDNRDATFERRLKRLEDGLAEIEKSTKGRISGYPPDQPTLTPDLLRDLNARIERLEKIRRASEFTPSETITPLPPVVATGVVRIQNPSLSTSLIRINNVTYTIRPRETISTTVPAGTFTYEVLADAYGVHYVPQLRVMAPNDLYTLTVNP